MQLAEEKKDDEREGGAGEEGGEGDEFAGFNVGVAVFFGEEGETGRGREGLEDDADGAFNSGEADCGEDEVGGEGAEGELDEGGEGEAPAFDEFAEVGVAEHVADVEEREGDGGAGEVGSAEADRGGELDLEEEEASAE